MKRVFAGRGLRLEELVLGLASGSEPGLVVWPGRVVKPDPHRPEGGPVPAERIRRSWEAGKRAARGPAVGLGEVASDEWRVTSDNSRAFGRAVRPVVGVGFVAGRAEVGVIQAVRVRGRVGRGSHGCC